MSRGLYVGRFQPFHKGHLEALKWILQHEDEAVIGIGSAQFSHTFDNPFTVGERIEMVRRTLIVENILSRCIIVPIPDIGQHSLWVSVVKQYCPRFDRVYSNEPLTRRLFIEAGCQVVSIPQFDREKYDATRIRRLMVEGGPWVELLPAPVVNFIIEVGGVERLKSLMRDDKATLKRLAPTSTSV